MQKQTHKFVGMNMTGWMQTYSARDSTRRTSENKKLLGIRFECSPQKVFFPKLPSMAERRRLLRHHIWTENQNEWSLDENNTDDFLCYE
jgi:hypothetical protein